MEVAESCCRYVFSVAGTGRLVRIEGKMSRENYRERSLIRISASFTFQQDNDPTHTAKTTQEWLQDKSLNVLEWPSRNPDLNPI